ncbi:anti-repressor SinI family protein [Neobacillus sp. PS3-12]|nr:anti-repressor SinI family protein [Neobacillus sp. PS3-12]WML51621.1 anti-repressor SinI family protein [Neobacillus sp. PS3-12]
MDNEELLDQEWVDLILEALNLGLSVDEIRNFLKQSQ